MRPHRITITTSMLAAFCLALSPSLAAASPLLSGYGGPGAGEQQIIGSTIVSGGQGRGGSGSSSGEKASTGEGSSGGSSSSGAGGEGETGTASGSKSASSGTVGHRGGTAAKRSGSASGKTRSSSAPTTRLPSAVSAANEQPVVFGLSNGEILLAVAIFVGLLLIGALTSWLRVVEGRRFGADDAHMGHSGIR